MNRAGQPLNIAGATVRVADVRLLAKMLDGELQAKLERAVANDNSIVALSATDRQQIVAVLAERPAQFFELRTVLVAQLAKLKKREALETQRRRMELDHDRPRRLPEAR